MPKTHELSSRLFEQLGMTIPLFQAPMAGVQDIALALAVAESGGLGALPCALLSSDAIRRQFEFFRARTKAPINLNFFCHQLGPYPLDKEKSWKRELAAYSLEYGLDPYAPAIGAVRQPFDDESCRLVEDLRPEVVSFHFGLPQPVLLDRIKASGAQIASSATTVAEALWLESKGCDLIIAQGLEAGGHRGSFLSDGLTTQMGTMALLPAIVDAVRVPVIAAGGIADGRGMLAAMVLGASAVQLGTFFLLADESKVSKVHRAALSRRTSETALTNLFTGRPARGIVNRLMRDKGPLSSLVPEFPFASLSLTELRAAAEARESDDFSPLWAGQAFRLVQEGSVSEILTELLNSYEAARERLGKAGHL